VNREWHAQSRSALVLNQARLGTDLKASSSRAGPATANATSAVTPFPSASRTVASPFKASNTGPRRIDEQISEIVCQAAEWERLATLWRGNLAEKVGDFLDSCQCNLHLGFLDRLR
jgi:hypothetical protein